jgi:catechol 2,3-dioxygenase-like lactoylglutathione lyase family enzyme
VHQGEFVNPWYSRPVFFVADAEQSLRFYCTQLGCSLDWNHQEQGRTFVCQVSRPGFELILATDAAKAGRGRIFVSFDQDQEQDLRKAIRQQAIAAKESWWGMPVIEIRDADGNELFFSPPSK